MALHGSAGEPVRMKSHVHRSWRMLRNDNQSNASGDGGGGDGDGGGDSNSGGGDGDRRWNASTPTVEKIRIERDRAKRELKEMRVQFDELKATVDGLESDKAKAEGRLDDVLKQKDSRIEALEAKKRELEEAIATRTKKDRGQTFAEAVAKKAGLGNLTVVRGLLREAADARELDTAPEEVTDDSVAEATKAIRELAPEMFTPKARGGSRGQPGHNRSHLQSGEEPVDSEDERVDALAEKYSYKSPATMGEQQGKQ